MAAGWVSAICFSRVACKHSSERSARVRLARHGRGLGAAAVHLGGVVDGEAGEAEAVGGVGVHGDDPRGKTGLEGVGGIEGGDGVHRAHVAGRAGVGRVVGKLREHGAEVGEGLAVVGAGGVGRGWCGLHELAPVMGKGADVVVSMDDVNWSFILTRRGLTGAGQPASCVRWGSYPARDCWYGAWFRSLA